MSTLSREKRLSWILVAVGLILLATVIPVVFGRKPDSLVVVAGARDVHYSWFPFGKQVRYEMTEPYPAVTVLKEISDQLTKHGYKPLRNSYLNPGQPSSHVRGWTFFVDGTHTPEEDVEQWLAQWENPRGNVVGYVLQYRSPRGGQANKSELLVYGMLMH